MGDYILRHNNFGLIYEISKNIATARSKHWTSAVVENASFLRSLYFPYKAPHWLYTSKFLHGFARFPCDSRALVT